MRWHTKDVGTLQDTLWLAVLEKGANVDRCHHSPLSCFWLFNAEMFRKTRQGRGDKIELDVCKKHAVKKTKRSSLGASGAECRAGPLATIVGGWTRRRLPCD
jgi:hypothetical protein